MGIIKSAFSRLLPGGRAWRASGWFGLVIDGLALSIESAKTFLKNILMESIPKKSTLLLPEWYSALGLRYDENLTLSQLQSRADLAFTSIGGSSLEYLESQVNRELQGVVVEEISGDPFDFKLKGFVFTLSEFTRLIAIVQRIFPLHLVPNYEIIILTETDTAKTGLAVCGRALTGKSEGS
jgi:hypothetical protein